MFKAFATLAGGNLFSKALGLVREILLAWAYGLSATAAAIRIAMAALFIPINLLTQDLLAAGYLPLYQSYKAEDEKLAKQYALFFTFLMLCFGLIICAALLPIAQAWVGLVASGLAPSTQLLASQLLQLFLLATPFMLTTSAATYGLMGNNQYGLQALRPSMQNIGIIGGVLLASYYQQILLIGYMFVVAQIAFCAIALFKLKPFLSTSKKPIKLLKRFSKDLWHLMKPLLLLPLILQGYIVLERNVASWLSSETVAALEVTKFITETAMALLAVPLGLIVLSRFSQADQGRSQQLVYRLAQVISLLLTPAAIVLLTFPEVIIQTLFQRGAFDAAATALTANIMQLFGLGILFHSINYQLLKMANAFQLSPLFLTANILGLSLGALGLLSYPFTQELAFGLAYILTGATSMIFLAIKLGCLKQLLHAITLPGGLTMGALATTQFATNILPTSSYLAQLLTATGIYLASTIILASPHILRTRTLNFKVWFAP